MKSILKISTLIFLSGVIFQSCCGLTETTCPDGRPVTYPKNAKCAMKAYEEVSKDFQLNLKSTVDVLDKVNLDIANLDVKNKTVMLRDRLNQESIRFQEALKSSFLAIASDPCENSKRHYKLIESVTAKSFALDQLKASLQQSTSEGSAQKTLNNYLYERGKKEGKAMGTLTRSLDQYFSTKGKYPDSLEDLGIDDIILILGESRLLYSKDSDSTYKLKFAGEDYALGTSDDKNYKGISGNTSAEN